MLLTPNAPTDCPYESYNSNHYAIIVNGDMWGHFVVNRTVNEEEDKLIKVAIDVFVKGVEE